MTAGHHYFTFARYRRAVKIEAVVVHYSRRVMNGSTISRPSDDVCLSISEFLPIRTMLGCRQLNGSWKGSIDQMVNRKMRILDGMRDMIPAAEDGKVSHRRLCQACKRGGDVNAMRFARMDMFECPRKARAFIAGFLGLSAEIFAMMDDSDADRMTQVAYGLAAHGHIHLIRVYWPMFDLRTVTKIMKTAVHAGNPDVVEACLDLSVIDPIVRTMDTDPAPREDLDDWFPQSHETLDVDDEPGAAQFETWHPRHIYFTHAHVQGQILLNVLGEAATWGRTDIVRMCLDRGGNAEMGLAWGAFGAQPDVVQLCIDRGAVNFDLAITRAIDGTLAGDPESAGRTSAVIRICHERGGDIDARDRFGLPLIAEDAVVGKTACIEIVRTFVELGSRHVADASSIASVCGRDDIVQLCMDHQQYHHTVDATPVD